ncbi:MAG: hypothetical protein HY344_00955 [Candidatus Levybacteria bacterium]|nr:hypothetical protein [Candidatus Levybacteria bacterium]
MPGDITERRQDIAGRWRLTPEQLHEDEQLRAFADDLTSRLIGPEGIAPPEDGETLEIDITRTNGTTIIIERVSIRQVGLVYPDGTLPTEIGVSSATLGEIHAASHRLQERYLRDGTGPIARAELTLIEPRDSNAVIPVSTGLSALGKLRGLFDRTIFRSLPPARR